MRILQRYRFLVGTKIPFDKWPDLIEQYLREQSLSHGSFHYCMESYEDPQRCRAVLDGTKCETCRVSKFACAQCRKNAEETLRKGTSCERAAKENPFLGAIHVRQTRYTTIQSLHNLSEGTNQTKESIYRILPKIYRRYGFAKTSLIYRDIDFFSRRVPTPAPAIENLTGGYEGSGITLCRSCIGSENEILLVVEARYPGEVLDATPYADALSRLLPGIRYTSSTKIIMDADEQSRYGALHLRAKPLVSQAKDFFSLHMPEEKGNDDPEAKVSVSSWLKKFAKRYGYVYSGYNYYTYYMEKKLPSGHYICLEFASDPSSPSADPYVSLCGLGFKHEIWGDGFAPQNSRDASEYFTKLFEALAEAEQTVFPAILDLYPQTPDWFMPVH